MQYFTGVKSLGTFFFQNCTSLKSVKLPEGLLELAGNVFENCPIQEIVLPSSLMYIIRNSVFAGTRLKELKIPENVVRLGTNNLPNTLEKFLIKDTGKDINYPDGAFLSFQNIPLFHTLVIPERVKIINVLGGLYLNAVYIKSTIPPQLKSSLNTFWSGNMKIYVPEGCSTVYKTATNWSWASNHIYEYKEGDIPAEYEYY